MEYDTVICIPYRNREKHLEGYLANVVPLLRTHFPGVHVAIMEQAGTKYFNRGVLMNVGCDLFKNRATYMMTNDVDTHPLEQTVRDIYTKAVDPSDVLGIYTSEMGTLGGVIKLRCETMCNMNGFPNDYWGWGVEDKALQNRAELLGLRKLTTIQCTDSNQEEYFTIFDDVKDKVEQYVPSRTQLDYFMWPHLSLDVKHKFLRRSGFNTLTYNVLERTQLNDITEKILIDIDSVQ